MTNKKKKKIKKNIATPPPQRCSGLWWTITHVGPNSQRRFLDKPRFMCVIWRVLTRFRPRVCLNLGLKRIETRHMTHITLGLSTNLLCEFGPLSFKKREYHIFCLQQLNPLMSDQNLTDITGNDWLQWYDVWRTWRHESNLQNIKEINLTRFKVGSGEVKGGLVGVNNYATGVFHKD